jgi:cell division protein FtsI (penicillin-binding protein 3)
MQPEVLAESICKPAVVQAAKESMEAVVSEGTGRLAFKDMPFPVAGKTGTAHVADGKIKYSHGVYQASFVGYFPADNPQYSCIVVIRTKPNAWLHYGGQLAAPVFRDIATRLYAVYVQSKKPTPYAVNSDSSSYYYGGSAPDIKNVLTRLQVSFNDSVRQNSWANVIAIGKSQFLKPNQVNNKMPDVKGMGLKDALYLLENMGLKIAVKGKGKIIRQSVLPGTVLARGITVMLELS